MIDAEERDPLLDLAQIVAELTEQIYRQSRGMRFSQANTDDLFDRAWKLVHHLKGED